MGGPGYAIKGEFDQNGFQNSLAHTRGVLSMARTMEPDSAGSQFFIMVDDAPHLDGAYAAFFCFCFTMVEIPSMARITARTTSRTPRMAWT